MVKWVCDQSARDHRAYGMQLVFETRRHTEVATSAANGPKQVGIFVPAGPHRLALSVDQLDRHEAVKGEAMLAHQPAKPAAEGETRDPSAGHDPSGDCQAVSLRRAVELGPGDTALRTHSPVHRIDANLLHWRQVDHHAAVDRGASRHVVAASADCHFEAEPPCQFNGLGHVRRAMASRDQRRVLVHKPVMDPARFLVTGIARLHELPAEGGAKLRRCSGNRSDCRHRTLSFVVPDRLSHCGGAGSKRKEFI
jgi:hypothetical protein